MVKHDILPELGKKVPGKYKLTFLNLAEAENYLRLVQYQEAFRCDSNEPVFIVVNYETILAGVGEIRNRLFNEIELAALNPQSGFDAEGTRKAELLSKRFLKFKWMGVAIAGLIDGINPCVFSALIFFISLLAAMRVTGRKILMAGVVYCLACFLCYLAIGFGLFSFLQEISSYGHIRSALEYGTVALLILFAVITLVDAIRYLHSHKADQIVLQLPDRLKMKVHAIMPRIRSFTG